MPIATISRAERFAQGAVSFNVTIAPDAHLPPMAGTGLVLARCWANGFNGASFNTRMPRVRVLVRQGPCRPGAVPDSDTNHVPGWF